MKRISKLLILMLVLCMTLSVGAFASAEPSAEPSGEASAEAGAVIPGTYTDGTCTLIIAEDMTFTMDKTGQNMDGAEFVLTVTGTVDAAANFTITGLFDGELNLIDMATEDQIAADLASVQAVYAAAAAAPSAEAGAVTPGTYTDGINTLIIADDMTFTMDKTGLNMDGAEFVLTVTGTVDAAGNFTITGLFDGELNLIEMATAEQIAADLASVQAAYQG